VNEESKSEFSVMNALIRASFIATDTDHKDSATWKP
jgi:hypothetical protein